MKTIQKHKIKSFTIIFAFFLLIIFLWKTDFLSKKIIQYITLGGAKVQVDLATTQAEQTQGLSGRQSLADGTGMLFIFSPVGTYYFWMKDMNFPIDMIWIDQNNKVIYIQKNATPASYPNTFGPNQNTKYVLEITSGFADKHDVKVGDSATFSN